MKKLIQRADTNQRNGGKEKLGGMFRVRVSNRVSQKPQS